MGFGGECKVGFLVPLHASSENILTTLVFNRAATFHNDQDPSARTALAYFLSQTAQTVRSPAFHADFARQSEETLARAVELMPAESASVDRVTDTKRNLAKIWNAQATALSAAQEFSMAAQAYRKALSFDPAVSTTVVNLAIVLFNIALTKRESQPAEEAEALFRQAIQSDPKGGPFFYLGLVQEATGRQPEAQASWEQAVAVAPESPQAAQARAKLAALAKAAAGRGEL